LSIRQTAALLCQTTPSETLKPRGQSAALNLTNAARYFSIQYQGMLLFLP
jgi:hypothetical protein